MREMDLLTPGHPQPLDLLVGLGLALAILDVDPASKVTLQRVGTYHLRVKTRAKGRDLLRVIKRAYTLDYYEKLLGMLRPQPGVESKILSLPRNAWQEMLDPFQEYSLPNHLKKRGEGRSGKSGEGRSGKRETTHVQVAPWAGKYVATSYRAIEDKYYLVCPLCAAFAWYGALRTASVYVVYKRKKIDVVYSLPDPSTASTEDLLLLSAIFGEKFEQLQGSDVPALAAPLITLAEGESIYPLMDKAIDVYVWKHSKERTFIAIRGLARLPMSPLLKFIAEAKAENAPIARLVRLVVRGKDDIAGEPELLSTLVECLIYGTPEPYNVIRSLWSYLYRQKATHLLRRSIVEPLYSVWSITHASNAAR